MAIEISSKPKNKEPFWLNFILHFLLIIFLVSISSYFILFFSQKKINKKLAEIERGLIRTDAEKALEDKLFIYQKKIEDFNTLLENHRSPLSVFSFLEKNVHPGVWFSSLDLNLEKNTLSLSGYGKNPETVEEQLLLFKEQELVKNVTLLNFSSGNEEQIKFDLQIVFDPKIFQ